MMRYFWLILACLLTACQAGGTVNPYITLNGFPPGVTIGCSFTAAGQVQTPTTMGATK